VNPRAGESRQRVYGGYTRAELDAQYDTALPAGGDVQRYFDRFTAASESARSLCPFETLRYGAGDRETVDIFPAGRAGAPLFVWLHGGYWRRMSKESFSFVAPPVVAAGGAVAVVNYPLAPAATLAEIVAAVRRAYAFVIGSTRASGANDPRIVVGGHSVGAQLAAMTAAVAAVHGFLALSGLYELEPLLHTQINETIAMDADVARRYGPIHVPVAARPARARVRRTRTTGVSPAAARLRCGLARVGRDGARTRGAGPRPLFDRPGTRRCRQPPLGGTPGNAKLLNLSRRAGRGERLGRSRSVCRLDDVGEFLFYDAPLYFERW